jgi:hypothetical protein
LCINRKYRACEPFSNQLSRCWSWYLTSHSPKDLVWKDQVGLSTEKILNEKEKKTIFSKLEFGDSLFRSVRRDWDSTNSSMRSKSRFRPMISSRQRWGNYSSLSDFDSQMPVMVIETSLFDNSIHYMSFEMEELKRSIEKRDA